MRWFAADSAERSASRVRACAWRSLVIEGISKVRKLSRDQLGVICRPLNATRYQIVREYTYAYVRYPLMTV